MNLVILCGHLGRDPESKQLQSGSLVCNMSVATSKKVQGDERTEWHRVVCFGKTAEFAAKYLAKGRLVLVRGELQTRSWEGKDGQKRYSTEVIANNVEALGPRPDGERGDSGQGQLTEEVPDDIPF